MAEGLVLDPSAQVAVISGLSALALALVTGLITIITLLIQTKRAAQSADAQVSNNHVREDGTPINLREESDDRHQQVLDGLEAVKAEQRGMRRDIGRIDGRTANMEARVGELADSVHAVESTQQRETIAELRQQLRNTKGQNE